MLGWGMAELPPKPDVMNALLQGPSVYVHLDPRREGVIVPQWFKKQTQLVLQLGLNMAVPIPDLEVGAEGISCTLSFNRQPHWCVMPWGAVYALVGEDGRGMIWPDDVPPELAAQQRRPALKVVEPQKKQPKKKPARKKAGKAGRPKLQALPSEPPPAAPPADADGKKELPPYLRVIK